MSNSTPAGRKRRQRGENASMTYLVEAAEDEIIDLAEPDALARHLTVAASASLAKDALRRQDAITPITKRARPTPLSAATLFPKTPDGKIVITDTPNGKFLLQVSCSILLQEFVPKLLLLEP